MKKHIQTLMGVAALALLAGPALATSTNEVTTKSSTVNPDGSVDYQRHTIVRKGDTAPAATVAVVPVTFYYYDVERSRIVAADDMSESIFNLWDKDSNDLIDMDEFYSNQMVIYEPIEYSKRTYQDVDADGALELTQQEYTLRLQQISTYSEINKDDKEGISVHEFIDTGFQKADANDDNYISYDELRNSFYGQPRFITTESERYND